MSQSLSGRPNRQHFGLTGSKAAYSYRADPTVPEFPDDRPVIVFDGHCVFCSAGMRAILRADRKGVFRFLPAQTPLGEALYRHYGLDPGDYESNILIAGGVARFKADGSIAMAERLGWPWKAFGALRVFPRGWLDAAYNLVARNRMKIFGRSNVCYRPEPGDLDRVLG